MKKKLLLLSAILPFATVIAQDHFTGLKTSSASGVISASTNPAELINQPSKFTFNLFAASAFAANNKISANDLINSNTFEKILFADAEATNARIETEVFGPGFTLRLDKWAFGVSTKAVAKMSVVNFNSALGDALYNTVEVGTTISDNNNQRLQGASWSEVGFSVARNLTDDENFSINVGATFKLLFPGAYANIGINKLQATIDNLSADALLRNTSAGLNIAYTGNIANGFDTVDDYNNLLYNKMGGVAADIGFNYKIKDAKTGYRFKLGAAIKNIGNLVFEEDAENVSKDYSLNINNLSILNLSKFNNVNSIKEVETILSEEGYLTQNTSSKSMKLKLPTVFSVYADVKIVPKLFVSGYFQHKLGNDDKNDQITTQNILTLTPHLSLNNFEVFSPWSKTEVAGITGGFGFRFFGFFIGSNSVITAMAGNGKQLDAFIGYRLGIDSKEN